AAERFAQLRLLVPVRPDVEEVRFDHRRAVVFVGDHDDDQVRLVAHEALVFLRRRATVAAERPQHGRELVLEAAAAVAERGDAGEDVLQIAGVVRLARDVGDERRAPLQPGGRTGAARGGLEYPSIAAGVGETAARAAVADRTVARAHVRRDDGDVDVGQSL